ncbi:hypothetical protein [Candidatus Palauibacter sp.]|uniref:hypothetical protein n=1 Tax=Candidatus Palauibacter sp. TaxID=3101350 RepID=UPI003CC6A54F
MTVVTVSASSAAGATDDGAIYELTKLVNTLSENLSAAMAKLDADGGVTDTDYESLYGGTDTIEFRETGAPT